MRPLVKICVGIAGVVALGLAPILVSGAPGQAQASAASSATVSAAAKPKLYSCRYMVNNYRPGWAPPGWTIRCKNRYFAAGATRLDQNLITVLNYGPKPFLFYQNIIAHEWAHAESHSWGQAGYAYTAHWMKLLGLQPWSAPMLLAADKFWNYSGSWYTAPVERYAEARVVCAGIKPVSGAQPVSCAVMNSFLDYIKKNPEV